MQLTHKHLSKIRTSLLFALSTAALTTLVSGCGMLYESGTFNHVYNNTLKVSCASCHSPGGSAWADNGVTLDFSSKSEAYRTLLANSAMGQSSSICSGVKIITPGNASTSYFAAVLFEDYSHTNFVIGGCTPYSVHHQDQSIGSSDKESILAWINNGAQDN